jgi:hypothetical protein
MLPKEREGTTRGKIVERKALSRHVLRRSRWIILAVLLMLAFMPRSAEAASVKKITLLTGQTRKLKRENAVWESKNSSVASVSSDGVVTANLRGKTTIKATVDGKRYRYRITVEEPVLSRTSVRIRRNKSKTLRVKGTSKAFKITSSDPSIVKVKKKAKNKFKLRGRRDGVATVRATYKNTVLECVVIVGNGNAQGNITLSHNGTVLQTLTGKRSQIGKSVSAVSSHGQSAPLYISTGGGDGLGFVRVLAAGLADVDAGLEHALVVACHVLDGLGYALYLGGQVINDRHDVGKGIVGGLHGVDAFHDALGAGAAGFHR